MFSGLTECVHIDFFQSNDRGVVDLTQSFLWQMRSVFCQEVDVRFLSAQLKISDVPITLYKKKIINRVMPIPFFFANEVICMTFPAK